MRPTRGDRGASILELALLAPVLAMVVMGVLDLGRAHRQQIRLDGAAREGAAHALLAPNDVECTGDDDIAGKVAAADAGLPGQPGYSLTVLGEDASGDPTVPVTGCGGSTVEAGEHVRVEVGMEHRILTPLVAMVVGDEIPLTGSSEVEVLG